VTSSLIWNRLLIARRLDPVWLVSDNIGRKPCLGGMLLRRNLLSPVSWLERSPSRGNITIRRDFHHLHPRVLLGMT